ncbi:MAG: hypothetical protein DRI39_06025 [Chloroflexi bacterium]|nr:MAG: hypothetical protein DRI39_06025 [Chloroflexota bacterium]
MVIIGPTSTWRQDWGMWEAIRDIIQNSLDECETYDWGYDDQGLYISDTGRGIAVENILLGPPKLKPDYARGRFGEGMKIAALVILREGYRVRIETVGRELHMAFVTTEVDGHVEQLGALWRPDGTNRGTVFHIEGYFGPAYEDHFVTNIPAEAIIHEGVSTVTEPVQRYNQLIAHPAGRIYARDIYMRDINSPWSYNLWGFEMAPDRHAPTDERDLHREMGRLWATVRDTALLQQFLSMVQYPPAQPWGEYPWDEYSMVDMTSMGWMPDGTPYSHMMVAAKELWQSAWRSTFGDNVVLRTNARLDNIVRHLDYVPQSVAWAVEPALAKVVPTDQTLIKESQDRLRDAKVVPDDELDEVQRRHLELARNIGDKVCTHLGYADTPIHAAFIPPASDRTRTAGMYNRVTREILISPDRLTKARYMIDTLIHELAHRLSGEDDLTEGHSSMMTEVAAEVVSLVQRGQFDMRGVLW